MQQYTDSVEKKSSLLRLQKSVVGGRKLAEQLIYCETTIIFRALAYQTMTYNQEKMHTSALKPKTKEEKHHNSVEPQ